MIIPDGANTPEPIPQAWEVAAVNPVALLGGTMVLVAVVGLLALLVQSVRRP
jgi:hypothetical protein